LLLIAGASAIALLWVLARIRFDERPVTPNPVAPVLSQLSVSANYDALASQIADLQARLTSLLTPLDVGRETSTVARTQRQVAALNWREGLAIAVLPAEQRMLRSPNLEIRAMDPATGLALIRLPGQAVAFAPTPWIPRRMQEARFLVSSTATTMGVSLRPTFVGSLISADGVAWPGAIWAVPSDTELEAGSFLFTTTGELAGLAVARGDGFAIVPIATVMAEAERLASVPPRPAGTIAADVQPLTNQIAEVTGAKGGVVVTWIRRDGPARGKLMIGDVIEAVDGRDLESREQWNARVSRLTAGEPLALRVRRRGETHDVPIEAAAVTTDADGGTLGLEMRRRRGLGAEVTRVEPASIADRAGLSAGDIITLVANTEFPSPNQVVRSYASLRPGDRVMVAVTRGETHYVTVFGR
jgi:hypothetical protein